MSDPNWLICDECNTGPLNLIWWSLSFSMSLSSSSFSSWGWGGCKICFTVSGIFGDASLPFAKITLSNMWCVISSGLYSTSPLSIVCYFVSYFVLFVIRVWYHIIDSVRKNGGQKKNRTEVEVEREVDINRWVNTNYMGYEVCMRHNDNNNNQDIWQGRGKPFHFQ